MIRIDFSPLEKLPVAAIADRGAVSKAFLDRGIHSLRDAARFVRQLPYGFNASSEDSMVLFSDGFGTCTTKHGIVARLAGELGVPIDRCEGFYPLTEEIVEGVGSILERARIDYIPRIHCFLRSEDSFFDLTEGNCTGKKGMIRDYLKIFKVEPDRGLCDVDRDYRDYYSQLCAEVPAFARIGVEGMLEALSECAELNAASCSRAS